MENKNPFAHVCNSKFKNNNNCLHINSSDLRVSIHFILIHVLAGPFTIFAPTNEAFEALGDLLELLKTNPDLLGGLLAFHVTNGAILSSQLDNDQLIVPISGERVKTRIRANIYTTPQGQVSLQ